MSKDDKLEDNISSRLQTIYDLINKSIVELNADIGTNENTQSLIQSLILREDFRSLEIAVKATILSFRNRKEKK